MKSACLVLLTAVAAGGCRRTAEPPVLPVGGDFVLTDHTGRPFESTSLRGSVVLVFFGYTFCPDACPTTLSQLSSVSRALGADKDRVKTLYITVDPMRDTPEVLREHLSVFGVDAVGLTGTPDRIAAVARQFAASYEIEPTDSEAKYLVSHTTTLYAIDARGRTRLLFPYEATVDEIANGIRSILSRVSLPAGLVTLRPIAAHCGLRASAGEVGQGEGLKGREAVTTVVPQPSPPPR